MVSGRQGKPMSFGMKIWIRILSALMVLGALTGCGRDGGQEEGQDPVWKQALFSAPDRKETRTEYQVAHRFSLEGNLEAAILETCFAAAQIRPGEGCDVTFYSRENGEVRGAASLPGDYAACEIKTGRQEEAVVFLQPSSAPRVREVWLVDAGRNCRQLGNVDFSDLPDFPIPPKVNDVQITEEGTVFLWYSAYILAKDSGLERHKDAPEGALYQTNRIYVLGGEGRLRGYASESDRVFFGEVTTAGYEIHVQGESGWFQETVDVDGRISEQKSGSTASWMEGIDPALCRMPEKTAYYVKDDALWKRDDGGKGSGKAFDLVSFGISQEEIRDLRIGVDGRIGMIVQRDGETTYLCMEEGESEITVLTLADIGAQTWTDLYGAVAEFNRTHQDCRVEIVDYHDENVTYDEALTRLQLDFTRGNAPDLLVTSSIPDGSVYAGKGMLCDLYGFMEGDGEINRETVVPSVLKAYEENGGLYVLAPRFVLITMCGPKSVLGDGAGLSFQDLRKVLIQNPDKYVYGFLETESAISNLLRGSMDDYIDWETGTCHFDCSEFRDLLEFIKKDLMPREYVSGNSGTNTQLYLDYRGGKIMLQTGRIEDACDYSMMKELFGEDVTFVGYPSSSGVGACISLEPVEVSIMSASQNQDKAWEFLKFYCTYVNPDRMGTEAFSILSSRLEEQLKESQTTQYFTNEIGMKEKSPKRFQGDTYNSICYFVYEATREEAETVARLIENSNTRYGIYADILKIILEECASYLAGDKKASEVSKVIQGRVRLYLAE